MTVPRPRECARCGGSGAEPGTELVTCPICEGKGEVQVQQGFFSLMRQCKECSGRGKLPETHCQRCKGAGEIDGTEIMPIDIPAGVPDGQTLRWAGKGATRRPGGDAGDLLIEVQVAKHRLFDREEGDLHIRFPISYTQASLGSRVEVPTLTGSVFMQVPPGTQEGRVFRLRGKGLPQPGQEQKGDQYVRIEITSPEEIQRHRSRLRDDESEAGPAKKIWKRVRRLFD